MNSKKWIGRFFLYSLILVLLTGLFNYIVDPYGLYRIVEYKGFNQQKEGLRNRIRYVKALEIALRQPKTILMGSSRVHDCINPANKFLANYQPVYNYSLDMARIKEIKLYLEHAILNSKIENLILGLDFFMFNKYEKLNFTFDHNIVNKKISYFDLYFKPLFTMTSLDSSIRTIKVSYLQKNRKEFLPNGYRPGTSVFYGLKDYKKLHDNTNWIFLSSIPSKTLYYAKMDVGNEAYSDFNDILLLCKQHKINVVLYISPAHANLDGEGIKAAGIYKKFEDWKRKITLIANDQNITLWDFSGYNTITTEPVRTPMKYYWDSSHFTEEVGNFILERILSKDTDPMIPQDFGVQITPSNIESHIKNIERSQYLYENNNSSVNELQLMYRDALDGKKIDSTKLMGMF